MTNIRTTFSYILIVIIMASCGNSKKLELANEQNKTWRAKDSVLSDEVASLKNSISECRKQADEEALDKKETQRKLLEANQSIDKLNAKLMDMNKILDDQSVSLNDIRKEIFTGLHQIQDSGISVTYRNGMIFVSMRDQFMFETGSKKVKQQARQALIVIADVLATHQQVNAIIVGHTDSVKTSGRMIDNWSLSAERAVAIARMLTEECKADPARIIVAGRSKYDPVASNMTADGRSKNRRTDIIINPDLSRLWQLSQKYPQ